MRIVSRVLVASAFLFLLACSDDAIQPRDRPFLQRSKEVPTPLLSLAASPASGHVPRCFVSTKTNGNAPFAYRYQVLRPPVASPPGAQASQNLLPFRYRRKDATGQIIQVVNCFIPQETASLRATALRFVNSPALMTSLLIPRPNLAAGIGGGSVASLLGSGLGADGILPIANAGVPYLLPKTAMDSWGAIAALWGASNVVRVTGSAILTPSSASLLRRSFPVTTQLPPPPGEECVFWEDYWQCQEGYVICYYDEYGNPLGCWPPPEVPGFVVCPYPKYWDLGQCVCLNGSPEPDCSETDPDPEPDTIPHVPYPDGYCDPLLPDDPDCLPGSGDPDPGGDDPCEDCWPPLPPPGQVDVFLTPTTVAPGSPTSVRVLVWPGVEGYSVELLAEEVQRSGGHNHLNRPLGSFTLSSGTTDNTGTFVTSYTASSFGGEETIRAVVLEGDVQGEATLNVGVQGLVSLPDGDHYNLTGGTPYHSLSDNHYGTPAANANLVAIANAYEAAYTGAVLWFNDQSLPKGGLFDIGPVDSCPGCILWHTPHVEHRFGTNCDVRWISDPARRATLEDLFRQNGSPEFAPEGNHWHLRFSS